MILSCLSLLPILKQTGLTKEKSSEMWSLLEQAIHKIQQKEQSQLSFEELYRYERTEPDMGWGPGGIYCTRKNKWNSTACVFAVVVA